MDIFKIDKDYLTVNINKFLEIVENIPNEYWSKEHFLQELNGKWEYSLGIKNNDHLLGYIIASIKKDKIHIHKFMIHEDFRSKGLGKNLLCSFIKKSHGHFKAITLKVYKNNIKAINLYHANGFVIDQEYNELLEMIKEFT